MRPDTIPVGSAWQDRLGRWWRECTLTDAEAPEPLMVCLSDPTLGTWPANTVEWLCGPLIQPGELYD